MATCNFFDNLGQDVLDQLLFSISDFSTLHSVILTTKSLYNSYTQRKAAVVSSVAGNEGGPTWSDALLAAKISDGSVALNQLDNLNFSSFSGAVERIVDFSETGNANITPSDISNIISILRTAKKFEEYFSIRKKDRSFNGSCLKPDESFRFKRAFYRFCILQAIASAPNAEESYSTETLNAFKNLDTFELAEIAEVWNFVLEVVKYVLKTTHEILLIPGSVSLIKSPSWIAQNLEQQNEDIHVGELQQAINEWHFSERLVIDFNDMLTAKGLGNMSLEIRNDIHQAQNHGNNNENIQALLHFEALFNLNLHGPHMSYILDTVIETTNKCDRCNRQSLLVRYWGENNWCWLKSFGFNAQELIRLLPGSLSTNPDVCADLVGIFQAPNFRVENLMRELFDLALANPNGPRDFKRNQWLCTSCLKIIIKRQLVNWYVNRLIANGHVFQPNCMDGWRCPRQADDAAHNAEFNHICVPQD